MNLLLHAIFKFCTTKRLFTYAIQCEPTNKAVTRMHQHLQTVHKTTHTKTPRQEAKAASAISTCPSWGFPPARQSNKICFCISRVPTTHFWDFSPQLSSHRTPWSYSITLLCKVMESQARVALQTYQATGLSSSSKGPQNTSRSSAISDTSQRRSQGWGAEGAQAPPLSIRILMFIFLVIYQHCKSRSGVLQNVFRQYHKA